MNARSKWRVAQQTIANELIATFAARIRESIHNMGLAHEELGAAMNIERASAASSLIDVLDRVLDKGIVIDAWVRVSVIGIDLITVEARVVVASFETYLKYADAFVHRGPASMRSVVVHGGAHLEVTHSRRQVTRRAR